MTASPAPAPAARRARSRAALRALLASLLLTAAGCAPTTGVDERGVLHLVAEPRAGVLVLRVPATGVGRAVSVRRSIFSTFTIPRGHVPPPGTCRIWYHHLAPGRQPPMGPCPELERQAPAGSYLIYG